MPTVEGVNFDRVLHAEDDLGIDPTAMEPVAGVIEQHFDGSTAIEFPAGDYLLETGMLSSGTNGIVGLGEQHTDTVFWLAEGGVGRYWKNTGGEPVWKNASVHCRDDERTLGNGWWADVDGGVMRDFELLGRIPNENVMSSPGHLFAFGTKYDARLTVDGFAIRGGRENVVYPDGAQGIWVAQGHEGIIDFSRVHIEALGSNAFRYTHAPGAVHLKDSLFRNNYNSNVRFYGGRRTDETSSMENVVILQDGQLAHLPFTRVEDTMNEDVTGSDGICMTVECEPRDGGVDIPCEPEYAPVIRNCDFILAQGPYNNVAVTRTVSWDTGESRATFDGCRFLSETGDDIVAGGETWTMRNCDFGGSGAITGTVSIEDSCVADGVDVSGVSTTNVTRGGCDLPPTTAPDSPMSGGFQTTPECTSDADCPDGTFCQDGTCVYPEPSNHTLVVRGAGSTTFYTFEVDGHVEAAGGGDLVGGDYDSVDRSGDFETVDGVTGGTPGTGDTWVLDGTVTSFSFTDDTSGNIEFDGATVTPEDFPLPNTPTECGGDTDCPDGQVCQGGECVDATAEPGLGAKAAVGLGLGIALALARRRYGD